MVTFTEACAKVLSGEWKGASVAAPGAEQFGPEYYLSKNPTPCATMPDLIVRRASGARMGSGHLPLWALSLPRWEEHD